MSLETSEWLNKNTLIGFTDKRGPAWHYREGSDNHYAGAVPVEDVQRRLFDWTAEERPLYVGGGPLDGNPRETSAPVFMEIPGRKAIVRSDNGHVMGIFKDGYRPHQFGEWLVDNVATILDDTLSIGSAGLLKGGAVAWVSVEVPDTITTPEGVQFRPNLLAVSSFDGSIATTYKRIVTNVVCDNTMRAGMSEEGQQYKVKSTKNSMTRYADAREALMIIHTVADDFAQEVKALCEQEVTDKAFEAIVDAYAPLPEVKEGKGGARGLTLAENKREALWRLWRHDERVSPWNGTAYGVWQAMNTYRHHEGIVRSASRAERNMMNAVDGSTTKADTDDMQVIQKVLAMAA